MVISGTILGVIVGCLTLLILKFSPVTLDELNEWQYNTQKERDEYVHKLIICQ